MSVANKRMGELSPIHKIMYWSILLQLPLVVAFAVYFFSSPAAIVIGIVILAFAAHTFYLYVYTAVNRIIVEDNFITFSYLRHKLKIPISEIDIISYASESDYLLFMNQTFQPIEIIYRNGRFLLIYRFEAMNDILEHIKHVNPNVKIYLPAQ